MSSQRKLRRTVTYSFTIMFLIEDEYYNNLHLRVYSLCLQLYSISMFTCLNEWVWKCVNRDITCFNYIFDKGNKEAITHKISFYFFLIFIEIVMYGYIFCKYCKNYLNSIISLTLYRFRVMVDSTGFIFSLLK